MSQKVMVVYAHPNEKSYSGAVLRSVTAGLSQSKNQNQVTVVDLYKEDFEARLVVNETIRRRDMDKVEYTQRYRQLLADSDTVILVYPIWWGSFPAILKGFLDRVLVSGLAYSFAGKKPGAVFPKGLMKGKKLYAFYTLDSPWIVAALDPGWFGSCFSVFWYCGFSKTRRFFLSGLKRRDETARRKWLERVERICARL